jgi:hypothetical protein
MKARREAKEEVKRKSIWFKEDTNKRRKLNWARETKTSKKETR